MIVAVGFIGYASGGTSSSKNSHTTSLDYDPLVDSDDLVDFIEMYSESFPDSVSVKDAIGYLKYGTRPYTPYYEDNGVYPVDAIDSYLYCALSYSGNYTQEYLEDEYVDTIGCTVFTGDDFESDDFFYRTNFAKNLMAADSSNAKSQAALAKKFLGAYSQLSKKENTAGVQTPFSALEKMKAVKKRALATSGIADTGSKTLVKQAAVKPSGVPSASEVAAVLMVATEKFPDPGMGTDTWGCTYSTDAVDLTWGTTPEGLSPVTILCNFYHDDMAVATQLFRNAFGYSKK